MHAPRPRRAAPDPRRGPTTARRGGSRARLRARRTGRSARSLQGPRDPARMRCRERRCRARARRSRSRGAPMRTAATRCATPPAWRCNTRRGGWRSGARSCRYRREAASWCSSCAQHARCSGAAKCPTIQGIVAFMKRTHEALSWDDVRLFLALYRSRTVGVAAATLGVDASTVSRRLVLLEDSVKATLFDRGRAGVAPTKAAEDLMPVAEEIDAAIPRFTHAAEGLEREVSGLVRITCPPDVAQVIVTPVLRELRVVHPALRFQLAPGAAVLDLTRREADLAVRTVRPTTGDLIVTRLPTIRRLVAASPRLAHDLAPLRRTTAATSLG